MQDYSKALYGKTPLIQSSTRPGCQFDNVSSLVPEAAGKSVRVRARIHAVRGTGSVVFVRLRQRQLSVQAVFEVSDAVSKQMVKFISKYVSDTRTLSDTRALAYSLTPFSRPLHDPRAGFPSSLWLMLLGALSRLRSPLPAAPSSLSRSRAHR